MCAHEDVFLNPSLLGDKQAKIKDIMDRKSHPKHYPTFTPARPYVDQYMCGTPRFSAHDPYPPLNTGVSQPIYDVHGNIAYSLPLEMYPPANDHHRQIVQMRREGK